MKQDLWPDLKFPPINLYNVWPTESSLELHLKHFIETWHDEGVPKDTSLKTNDTKVHPDILRITGRHYEISK